MDVRFIHTGDVHIGQAFSNMRFGSRFSRLRRQEVLDTFNNILKFAKQESIHFLIIAGDLFEEELVTLKDIKYLENSFKRIYPTEVIIVAGNHDALINEKSPYQMVNWSSNVHILNTSMCKIEFLQYDITFWGFSWDTKLKKEPIVDNFKFDSNTKNNILVLHGDIYNESEYLPIHKENLLKQDFSYVALGHIHKPDFIQKNIAYSGSPEPLSFGETGEHGIILGTLATNTLDDHFELIPMAKRHIVKQKIKIDENMDNYQVIDMINNLTTNKEDIFSITIEGIKSEYIDIDQIKLKLENELDFIDIIDETEDNIDIDQLQKENENNLIGQYINKIKSYQLSDKLEKKALKYGLQSLQKGKGV